MTELIASDTLTVATGTGETVTVALPLLPSLVPVIVALPAATAFTEPLEDTVATDILLEDHSIDLPDKTLLLAS
jgi:hypothetical protein